MKRRRALLVVTALLLALPVSWVPSVAQEGKSMKERQAEAKRNIATEVKRAVAEGEDPTAAVNRVINEMIGSAISERRFKLLGTRLNIASDEIVKGAPYSATAITEDVQTLADGNQIIKKREATYARNSEGRIRIEQQLETIGKWTAAGTPPRIILISDPVAGHYYNLDPRSRKALKDPQGPLFRTEADEAKAKQRHELEGIKSKAAKLAAKSSTLPANDSAPKPKESSRPGQESSSDRTKRESLGVVDVEGIKTEVTRVTHIIPAGEIGNLRPIEVVDEGWYSPELQMMLMTKHSDPRSGEVTWRLTNINRSEPDRSLFEVPADYTIIDKGSPKVKTQGFKRIPSTK